MPFISQTRLLRTAQRNGDGSITQFSPPQQVARFPGIVVDLAVALRALTPVPDAEQWGGYELRYDGRYVYTTAIAGTHSAATNLLVVLYDVWETDADRLANPANPPYRNTHTMQIDPGLSANALRQRVRAMVEEMVVRHAIEGRAGDMRDPTLLATQTDPAGVLNKAQPLDGTNRAIDQTDATAPLLPNPVG